MKVSDELREQMAAFKAESYMRDCAACGDGGGPTGYGIRAHHVVYRQHLSAELEWDTRNAMPVCDDCHEKHHNASSRIPLSALSQENLEFANEVLGEAAGYYLERRYGSGVAA